jgi:hypothetical protein
MAPELSRGPGSPSDDFYALGVTLLAAIYGDTPLKGIDNDTIVQMKIERGTYNALVGERRFSGPMTELLRGLLSDDPKQRWSVADFDFWLSGRRLTPKQSLPARKAARPLRIGAGEYVYVRQLCAAMVRETKLAAATIQGGEMERWIGHGLADDNLLKNFDEARTATAQQKSGPEEERLVTNTALVLDPLGPIRYRGASVFPAGIPATYAQMILTDAPVQILAEIILNDFSARWLVQQPERRSDLTVAVQNVERAKPFLQAGALGSGIERALYEMAPSSPCLSHAVRDSFVQGPRQLLEALDRRSQAGMGAPMDRHIAAFLLARDKKIQGQVMFAIDQGHDPMRRHIGLITLYCDLQYRHGPDVLKGLAGALLSNALEAAKRFHYRPRQEKVAKDLREAAAAGSTVRMLDLIDDPQTLRLDEQEFSAARIYYAATHNEIVRLGQHASDKKALAAAAGQPIAAIVSIGLPFIVLIIMALRLFAKHAGG